jgi:hypothetical protein
MMEGNPKITSNADIKVLYCCLGYNYSTLPVSVILKENIKKC